MLPKLQQSSIANSLRRDNLASQIQCTSSPIQAKISWKEWLASKIIRCTGHGKTTTLPRILTVLSETFPSSTYPRKNWRIPFTSRSMNWLDQDHSQSILRCMATEATLPALSKKRNSFKSQCLNQGLFKREKWQFLNFGDTTIEGIFQLKSITKTLCQSWCGRCQSRVWTIITTFPYFLMELGKSSIHTDPLLFWVLTIYWKKEAIRYCQ